MQGEQTVANPTDTTLTLERGASKRFKVYEIMSSFTGTMSDAALHFQAQRFTTDDGAGAGLTPNPNDPADGAAVTTCLVNHSTEPSAYTSNQVPINIGQHLRLTFRWTAREGSEIVIPDTDSNGIGFFAVSTAVTENHVVTVHFEE